MYRVALEHMLLYPDERLRARYQESRLPVIAVLTIVSEKLASLSFFFLTCKVNTETCVFQFLKFYEDQLLTISLETKTILSFITI